MRATVSIPDALFEEADALARGRGIPRSQLYAAALKEYLASQRRRERRQSITERLNQVYQEEGADPFLAYAAALTFKRVVW